MRVFKHEPNKTNQCVSVFMFQVSNIRGCQGRETPFQTAKQTKTCEDMT